MSEEEDYMSDSFLLQTKSVRPGLRNTAQKRKDRAVEGGEGAPREKRVKRRENKDAQERMQQGLATPISATNKGFSLLCKMGYETGMGLGRTGVCECGTSAHNRYHVLTMCVQVREGKLLFQWS